MSQTRVQETAVADERAVDPLIGKLVSQFEKHIGHELEIMSAEETRETSKRDLDETRDLLLWARAQLGHQSR
jgi:hypothetical protein